MTHIMTVCGSLSSRSANRAALDVVAAAARAAGATVDDFEHLAELPAFDPDREEEPIEVLADWRRRLAAADAVVVAVPEYAGAVAGAVKNAFDWTVGGADLNMSQDIEEQPPRLAPASAIAMTRRMTTHF